jgi:co-chaperonin GroES (HSP10)
MITIHDIEVLSHHVLVEPLSEPETKGSLYLPERSVGADQSRGIVRRHGDGETLPSGAVRTLCIEPGDLVFYSKYAGFPIQIGDTEYQIIPEHSIATRVPMAMHDYAGPGSTHLRPPVVVRAENGKLYLADEQPKKPSEPIRTVLVP